MSNRFQKFIDFLDDPFEETLNLFGAILGKIYLTIRYPSKTKRQEVLHAEFDGRYELVAQLKIAQLVAFIIALIVLGGLIFFTVKIIRGEM